MFVTRRNFLKSLVLVPFIDWRKPVRFKLEFEPNPRQIAFINNRPYSLGHTFIYGNPGGGKSELLKSYDGKWELR